jgi:putative transposase
VCDRAADCADLARIRLTPALIPAYMQRSKSIETPLPILYLKGISTGDFSEALAALLIADSTLGYWKAAGDVWPTTRARGETLSDGIYLQARLEDEKQRILVLIGATPEGRVGFTDGARESTQGLS